MKVIFLLTHIAALGIGYVLGVFSPGAKYMKEGAMMATQGGMISHYASLVDIARNNGAKGTFLKA